MYLLLIQDICNCSDLGDNVCPFQDSNRLRNTHNKKHNKIKNTNTSQAQKHEFTSVHNFELLSRKHFGRLK